MMKKLIAASVTAVLLAQNPLLAFAAGFIVRPFGALVFGGFNAFGQYYRFVATEVAPPVVVTAPVVIEPPAAVRLAAFTAPSVVAPPVVVVVVAPVVVVVPMAGANARVRPS